MKKYYLVKFNNTSKKFNDREESIKHAQALDKLGYQTEVVQVEQRLYETFTKTIYQSPSVDLYSYFNGLERILNRHGGVFYDK